MVKIYSTKCSKGLILPSAQDIPFRTSSDTTTMLEQARNIPWLSWWDVQVNYCPTFLSRKTGLQRPYLYRKHLSPSRREESYCVTVQHQSLLFQWIGIHVCWSINETVLCIKVNYFAGTYKQVYQLSTIKIIITWGTKQVRGFLRFVIFLESSLLMVVICD